ncbi:family 43 glycosylhydrolase [Arthrobacter sp. ISL-48]|uniref:family 43 glycosylhydrolase n=1 Tax=Arthrobacter sp. ISL-48 TaxID=2819110 RepID=UPI001BEBF20B|nr:family 43 glycosylhydrolase [Arthrobacter sp. ISL-48]MBT2533034.1 family 43 glycosylhydrolase [Arthrobacter sp. ISL-48]
MTASGTWLRMAASIATFCIASTLVIVPAQQAQAVTTEDQAAVQAAASALLVTNIADVRGNLTLPTTGAQGTAIAWASEDSSVVDPTGLVHRPANGQPNDQVTLTATITRNDAVTTKAFSAVVPALPETPKLEAYMFPYFTGDSLVGENIYFGASNGNDARNWLTLNGGQPVKTSTMGTKGLRDPFIVRSPEGDKFYMIATDLSIGSGTTWDASQRQGSQYMEIWESTNLVNWSEQRHVKVSPDNAGNTWAPEAYYDTTLGQYVVFWASKLYNTADHSDSQPNQMLYATTRDFVTFSPAKVWQNTGQSRIDSTVIAENGTYYRFTKDEAQASGCLDIMQEHSTSLTAVTTVTSATSDTWKLDATCIGKKAGTAAVEGPTVFKANDGDVNGPGYYLFVDEFGGRKYIPLFSPSLQNATWTVPTGYSLPSPAPRHGTIMPITAAEQKALMGAYLPKATSVAGVKAATVVGTPAKLPRTATVTFADSSTKDLAVAWNAPVPADYYTRQGTVTVTGAVTGTDLTATATISVIPAGSDTLVHYDFSKVTGTVVPDSSPWGRDGAIKGTGATVNGDVLTLPGGAANSTAGYVQLPTGTFDGQNTLTISAWLKNETASGNYAAMFFGGAASPPSQYWLLNPRNPQGLFKSVITNGNSTSAPWGTEAGISPTNAAQGVAGPVTDNSWGLYTTVIEPNQVTGYFNGAKIGTVATTRTVSDFGTGLVSYIGRSSYPDAFYKGGVKDVLAYSTAKTAEQIKDYYFSTVDQAIVDAAVKADAEAINLGPGPVTGNLTLPASGAKGSTISWASSDPAVISTSGQVKRPADADAAVTLTATLKLGTTIISREFQMTVAAQNPVADLTLAAKRYVLRPTLVSGTTLPIAQTGHSAAFSTSTAGVSVTGNVLRTTSAVPVAATVTLKLRSSDSSVDAEVTKDFAVTVLPEQRARYILSYERAVVDTATYSGKLAYSMHLGLGTSTSAFTALNDNYGILFPKAQPTAALDIVNTRTLRNPYVFELGTGGYGVVATRALENGADDSSATSSLLYFTTPDLKTYTEVGLVDLGVTNGVNKPKAVWDSAASAYRVAWTADDGTAYHTSFGSLSVPGSRGDLGTGAVTFDDPAVTTGIAGAAPSNVLPVTDTVATELGKRYGRVTNTAVSVPNQEVERNAQIDLSGLAAGLDYSDGSKASLPVDWKAEDVAAVNTAVPGQYTVRGTVRQRAYSAPFIGAEADPAILRWKDSYLFIATDDANVINAKNMYLRKASTIEGLKTAANHSVATTGGSANIAGCFWAPELHEVAGELYIFFAPCIGQASWNKVQAHVQKLRTGGDPTVAADWEPAKQVLKADGSPLQRDASHPGISLDMTYFEDGGKSYVAWSQRYIGSQTGDAEIWVATVSPTDPTRLSSEPKKLVTSEYGWDTNTTNVAEGPFVIKRDGKVFLTYSGSNVDTTYALGLLTASSEVDLTDQSNWTKGNSPILKSDAAIAQLGPGHNSFTTDEDGNLVLVYHAKSTNTSLRDTYLRRVHWADGGRPVLDMSTAEEVAPDKAAVSITVTVSSTGAAVAPASPAAPSVTVDGTAVTVSWVKPGDGGSPISGYSVTLYRADGSVYRTAQADASVTSSRFTGLEAGSYRAAVVATNAVGDSSASATSAPVVVGAQLLARYDFSSVVGTSVVDASGNGKTATIVGSGATVSGKELTLPGGSSTSGAAYVKLPAGMFDVQNTLTISTWLKNGTGSGNYAAMFFGSAASPPGQYWLLNPRNPQGLFKSVITDGLNASAPWGTEAGISPTTTSRGIPGPATGTDWALYTTVITPGSITGYYNGTKIGTVATTRKVSDFGTGLVGYIGRSSYPDNFYRGGVRDVSVFSTAFSDADVLNAYYSGSGDPAVAKAALDADTAALNLGPDTIAADLTLPAAGAKGSKITWSSSDPAHLDANGKVTRPAAEDATVTLTAALELAGQSTTRTFTFTVVANTPQKDLKLVADAFNPAIRVVTENIILPAAVGNVAISWESSNAQVLDGTGKVTRPAVETPVTLTATFAANGLTEVRTYTVKVLAADGGRIGAYIQSGDTARTDALHLAGSQDIAGAPDSINYAALNNGRPVLYPTLGTAKFGSPVLFRKVDGSFGLVATVDSNSASIYVYDSADLVTFTGERLVPFNSRNMAAASVAVKYDNSVAAYRLTFVSLGDGKTYQVTTKDFTTFSDPVEVPAVPVSGPGTFPSGALQASSIALTKAEYDRANAKYSRLVNTGVAPFGQVTMDGDGQLALPTTSTVQYSNGSTTTMGVQWNPTDVAAAKAGKPGTYTVNGTVQQPTYPEKLVAQRADPDVVLGDDGYYYFTASYPMVGSGDPEGYDRVTLRRATTIAGLGSAPEVTIWDENTSALNRYVWAPELHKVGDSWYVFFTASIDSSVWSIRPMVLKLDGTDLMDRSKWRELGRMKPAAGDTEAFKGFSLDMTYFENAGKHYVVWAENPGPSMLRMATIDPADPSQLTSKSILLSTPTMAWEKNQGLSINEGPAVIKKDGKVFITFSAATVDAAYCIGLLSASDNGDLMNPASWTKNPYPILQTADVPGQAGPGHNSFTVDEYGNPVIVFHSRTVGEVSGPGDKGDGGLFDPGRHARAATVHFGFDGQPVLNMTAAEELADQYKNVQVKVVVPDSAAPVLTAGLDPVDATGDNGWYTGNVSLVASAADDSAVTIEYRVDGGAWLPYSAAVGLGEGTSTVEVRATDEAGNQSAISTLDVRRDATAPQVSASFDDQGGKSLGPVEVTLSGSDADGGSGLGTLTYSLDDGPWTTYSGVISVSGPGTHTLNYRAADAAGNTSEETATITIAAPDTTAPVLTVTVSPDTPDGSNGWWKSAVTVTAAATDDSGVVPLIEASRDGGVTWDVFVPLQLSDGSPAVKVRSVDAAGNVSAVIDRDIKIDSVVPSASAVVDTAARRVRLTGADADPGSGVASLEYRTGGAGAWTSSAAASTDVMVGADAATVEYRATDTAGNVSTAQSVMVPAEAAPKAAVTLTSEAQPSAEGWYAKDVGVTITAPAGTAAQYRLDGGAWKPAAQPFTVSANGPHAVDHRLLKSNVVLAGSAGSVAVKIDKIVPMTAALTSPESRTGTPRNPVTVVFSAQDSLSGVARIEYRLNLGAWTTIAAGAPVTIRTTGDYLVSYRSFDEAGNADKVRTTSVKITPDVPPSVKSSADRVKPGASLTFTVAGFNRWDRVVLTAGTTMLGTVFTDVKGAAQATLLIPAATPSGPLTITATGSDGEPAATVSVTVKK